MEALFARKVGRVELYGGLPRKNMFIQIPETNVQFKLSTQKHEKCYKKANKNL